MATAKQIAVRAWEIGPTWADGIGLAAAFAILTWVFDFPWWAAVPLLALTYVAGYLFLAWLDLLNEEFDQASDPDEAD